MKCQTFARHSRPDNLLPESDFKLMLKNKNDGKNYMRVFSIVIFDIESGSGVKWSQEILPGRGGPQIKQDFYV